MFTKRHRRSPTNRLSKPSLRSVAIVVLCFISFLVVVLGLAADAPNNANMASSNSNKSSKRSRFDLPEELPDEVIADLDAILVLGGGVPISMDEPPVFTQQRCDNAAKIVERHQQLSSSKHNKRQSKLPILCLSAGTAHLPQFLSADGLPVWEATSSAAYLMKEYPNLIDPTQLYVETTSYDTISNAFFARTSFTDISGWRRLLVVTNEVCNKCITSKLPVWTHDMIGC